jgi:hypothetical protein
MLYAFTSRCCSYPLSFWGLFLVHPFLIFFVYKCIFFVSGRFSFTEEGYEYIGFANQVDCVAYDAVRIVVSNRVVRVHRATPDSTINTTKHPLEDPDSIVTQQRGFLATMACVWILFDAVRNSTVAFARFVPTNG